MSDPTKRNPSELRRCPICGGPWASYSIVIDKCLCAFGHAYEPGTKPE